MHILLKDIIKEVESEEEKNPSIVQVYVDMDGVLVDMEKGFAAISGGLKPKEYEAKNGKSSFWKLIARHPNFWIELEQMPDAKVLWEFVHGNFKEPKPVILSAGQGARIIQQKNDWIRKHIDPSVKVIIAPAGPKKPEYTLNIPGRVTHLLIDDTQKNIDAWQNKSPHHIAILHTDAQKTIEQLKAFLPQ